MWLGRYWWIFRATILVSKHFFILVKKYVMISIASSISWIVRLNISFFSGCFHNFVNSRSIHFPIGYNLIIIFTRQNHTALQTFVVINIRVGYLISQNPLCWWIITHNGAKRKDFNKSTDPTNYWKLHLSLLFLHSIAIPFQSLFNHSSIGFFHMM